MEQTKSSDRALSGADSNKLHHLKFLMAIFVVIIHTNNIEYYGAVPGDWLHYIVTFFSVNLCRVAVPMFFFISGVLFFRNVATMEHVWIGIKKRARTLIIPYFWWNIFTTFIYLVVFQLPVIRSVVNSGEELSVRNVLFGIFLYGCNGRMWYLVHLMAFFLLSPILLLLVKRKTTSIITLFALLALNFSGFEYGEVRFFHLFYFYCGAFLVQWYPKILFDIRYRKGTSILALIPVLTINLITMFVPHWFVDKMAIIIMMIGLWVFADVFSMVPVRAFEKQSFFIYCIHGLPLETIEKLISMLGKSHVLGIVDYVLAPILCLLSIYILYRLLVKFVPGFYNFINGGRVNPKIQNSKG